MRDVERKDEEVRREKPSYGILNPIFGYLKV